MREDTTPAEFMARAAQGAAERGEMGLANLFRAYSVEWGDHGTGDLSFALSWRDAKIHPSGCAALLLASDFVGTSSDEEVK
jgi:hypothetical protein